MLILLISLAIILLTIGFYILNSQKKGFTIFKFNREKDIHITLSEATHVDLAPVLSDEVRRYLRGRCLDRSVSNSLQPATRHRFNPFHNTGNGNGKPSA